MSSGQSTPKSYYIQQHCCNVLHICCCDTFDIAHASGLMTLDAASMTDARSLDNAWRGAEAYHFWLLAHRQLYSGQADAALRTALQLRQYEEVLDGQDIYSFLGLAAFYSKFYGQCSKVGCPCVAHHDAPNTRSRACDAGNTSK